MPSLTTSEALHSVKQVLPVEEMDVIIKKKLITEHNQLMKQSATIQKKLTRRTPIRVTQGRIGRRPTFRYQTSQYDNPAYIRIRKRIDAIRKLINQ